jgi:hypothetical protein
MTYFIRQNQDGFWVLVGEIESTGQQTCEVYCSTTEDLVSAFLAISGSQPMILED